MSSCTNEIVFDKKKIFCIYYFDNGGREMSSCLSSLFLMDKKIDVYLLS